MLMYPRGQQQQYSSLVLLYEHCCFVLMEAEEVHRWTDVNIKKGSSTEWMVKKTAHISESSIFICEPHMLTSHVYMLYT